MPGVTLDARDDGLDRRNLDLVITAAQLLITVVQLRFAMATTFGLGDERFVRFAFQQPPSAFAPDASLTRPRPFRLVVVRLFVGFERLGRRDTGVAGVLRRLIQSCPQFGVFPLQDIHPFRQRLDLLPLHLHNRL